MGRGALQSDGAVLLYGPPARRSSAGPDLLVLPRFGWNQCVSDSLLSDLRLLPQHPRYNWEKMLEDLGRFQEEGWKTQLRQSAAPGQRRQAKVVGADTRLRVDVYVPHSVYDNVTGERIWREPLSNLGSGNGIQVECFVHARSLDLAAV